MKRPTKPAPERVFEAVLAHPDGSADTLALVARWNGKTWRCVSKDAPDLGYLEARSAARNAAVAIAAKRGLVLASFDGEPVRR